MSKEAQIRNRALFRKIKVLSNANRFRIVELVSAERMSITELSRRLALSYTKCADYVSMLVKEGIASKHKKGREVLVDAKLPFKLV